jgi:hypothetical protein
VCRFHVVAGAKLHPGRGAIYKLFGAVAKLASINLRKLVLYPTGSINLGFILREDLLLCSSYLPLGVPNWAVIYTPSLLAGRQLLRNGMSVDMQEEVGTADSSVPFQILWLTIFYSTRITGDIGY